MPDVVMLFAAGRGTRMGALTETRPKPLVTVAGRSLLDHALAQVDAAGAERIVVNTHYLGDQIRDHLRGRPDIRLSPEKTLLETGGGLRAALPLLGPGPVVTLNTDAVWTGANPIAELRAAWDPARMDALLLLIDPARAHGHSGGGDFLRDAEGRLTRGPGLIYSGVQITRTEGLQAIGDEVFSMNLLWDRMLRERRLFGWIHDGSWADVGHPEGIAIAEALLQGARDV